MNARRTPQKPSLPLAGKVALVTGAGSGIGRATAFALAAKGASVGVLSRTQDEVIEVCEAIGEAGGKALALVADVTDANAVADAARWLLHESGTIDIVVVNAGINGVWAPIDDLSPEEWDKTISVNLRGSYLTLHHTVPFLKRGGGGSVIIVSSINGVRTFTTPGATAYAATKAAQVAMTKQLALELGKHQIRVNAVCPGAIETEIEDSTEIRDRSETEIPVEWPEGDIPITAGRKGRPEDVADMIAILAGDEARHVTGSILFIDGGQSLLR